DQAELQQVVVRNVREQLVLALRPAETAVSLEADAHVVTSEPLLDVVFQALEGATADKEDVRRVDLEEVLVGMFAAALRRHVGHAAFDNLQKSLLHALAGNVPGDARVVALTRNLVDLIDVDDPALGFLDIEIRG